MRQEIQVTSHKLTRYWRLHAITQILKVIKALLSPSKIKSVMMEITHKNKDGKAKVISNIFTLRSKALCLHTPNCRAPRGTMIEFRLALIARRDFSQISVKRISS